MGRVISGACLVGHYYLHGGALLTCSKDYWKHDGLNPTHPIRDYMGLTRFEEIERYFHVTPPDAPQESATGRRLWQNKVEPILEQLRQSSKRYRVPSKYASLGECMIRAAGASKDTYKMPCEPIGQGFKFRCLADHGYIWDSHPTSNHSGPDPVPAFDDLTATGEVVYYLLR